MKLKNLAILLSLAFTGASHATNISVIDFSGTTSNIVTAENGTPVATGAGVIRIGYFNTAAQTATWAADLKSTDVAKVNSAMASFVPLGEGAAGAVLGTGTGSGTGPRFATRTINGGSFTGRLAGQITGVVSTTGVPGSVSASGVPAGTRIFMLVYSDSNTTLDGSEQFGVFSSSTWTMPADSGLNLQLNSTAITSETAAQDIFRGTFGSLHMAGFGPVIPEPTSTLVLLISALGLLARRRR